MTGSRALAQASVRAVVRAVVVGAAMGGMALAFSLTLAQALLLAGVGGAAAGIIRLSAGGKDGR